MLEEGRLVPANPTCEEGWHYHNTSCYWFSSSQLNIEPALDSCAEKGAYLTDVLSRVVESDFKKSNKSRIPKSF